MDAKLLTEAGWKDVAQKHKIKDNGLQKALADYQKVPTNEKDPVKYVESLLKRSKDLEDVRKFVGLLLKLKEVAASKDVTKYLKDVDAAATTVNQEISKQLAEVQAKLKQIQKEDAEKAAMAHPDPKALAAVYKIGENDALNKRSSRSSLFAKAPPFQKKYDEGFAWGITVMGKLAAQGPQREGPHMGSISKEELERSKQYTKDRAVRKELIQYLNEWWSTALPEDM
jgi:hypothetical protein